MGTRKKIYSSKEKDVEVSITAEIADGELTISDLSGGKLTSELMGSDFAEHYLSLDKVNTKKLFKELKVSAKSEKEQLSAIKEKFGKNTAIAELEDYCERHGIKTSPFVYPQRLV